MKPFVFMGRIILPLFVASMIFSFQGCKKSGEVQSAVEEIASEGRPPKSQQPVSFSNCGNPGFSGNFVMGSPANVTFTLNYINGTGGSYASFTSSTVNGITITAPSGTFNTGIGSITFTTTGTPVVAGNFTIPIRIGGNNTCNLQIVVLNPITVSTGDPGPVVGSTGGVSFIYQNQAVTYKTVRAADGKIWLQQNLGSPQVAFSSLDENSYGHLFQWGRWDDGHQLQNSSTILGNSALQNPSQIVSGNSSFIKNQTLSLAWWGVGGLSSDTWSSNMPTSTNGEDPCTALGAGWRMPTASDWQNLINQEDITNTYNAFQSNLKLPAGGVRFFYNGIVHVNGDIGYFWTSTADGDKAKAVFIDNAYGLFISATERGNGYPCRCVKD